MKKNLVWKLMDESSIKYLRIHKYLLYRHLIHKFLNNVFLHILQKIWQKMKKNLVWKFTDESSLKYLRIRNWGRWIRPIGRQREKGYIWTEMHIFLIFLPCAQLKTVSNPPPATSPVLPHIELFTRMKVEENFGAHSLHAKLVRKWISRQYLKVNRMPCMKTPSLFVEKRVINIFSYVLN